MQTSTLRSRVFVLGMLHDDGSIVASEVYDVGEVLGFTVHQIRLVFARLVTDGLFRQVGRGRAAVLQATSKHDVLHGPEVGWLQLAYDQDAGRAPWDGMWHLVAFSLEEERRDARNQLREVLLGMGGAAITAGLYVQALDWDDDVMGIAKRLDIVDNVVMATTGVLRVGHTSDPRQVAARLWPLDALADSYRSFVHDHAVQEPLIDDPVGQLAVSIAITAAFEECIRLDPLLPPELLPSPWAGTQARGVLRNRTKDLVAARRQTGHPALFARYDQLFDSLG